jgi:hypothetical protein
MGAQRSVQDDVPDNGRTDAESRIVRLDGGVRWRVSVVARLISEDIAAARASARLVVRLECLTTPRPPKRGSIAGASTLAEVGDEALRALIGSGGSRAAGRGARRRTRSKER